MASSVERSRSVSSMRRTNVPECRRAYSQEKSAVRRPPICRKPVGLGAKRVRVLIWCNSDLVGPKAKQTEPAERGWGAAAVPAFFCYTDRVAGFDQCLGG